MYIVTSRWHVTSMEAFKKSAAIADQWFKDKDVDTSTLVIATGDMVGDVMYVMRFEDAVESAKILGEWRESQENEQMRASAKEAENYQQEVVHYRSL